MGSGERMSKEPQKHRLALYEADWKQIRFALEAVDKYPQIVKRHLPDWGDGSAQLILLKLDALLAPLEIAGRAESAAELVSGESVAESGTAKQPTCEVSEVTIDLRGHKRITDMEERIRCLGDWIGLIYPATTPALSILRRLDKLEADVKSCSERFAWVHQRIDKLQEAKEI